MSENNNKKWVEIARAGTFTDSAGRPQTFTPADLAAIASSYDPAQRDAPLCFGHPADNAPAFGWVQQLKAEGEKLFASFAHVPATVKDLVAKKHYRHVSISLMPDRVSLRHVALLGAAQPAIDGLAAVEFTGGDHICVEFSADSPSEQQKEKTTMPTTEELQQQIMALQQQVQSLTAENAQLKAEKGEKDKEKDAAEAKAEEVAAEFAAYKGTMAAKAREARAGALVAAGKLTPASKENALSFAAALDKVPDRVDFAAPDGSTQQISAEERYWRELEARPVDGRFADFSAPPAHVAAEQAAPTYTAADMAAKL